MVGVTFNKGLISIQVVMFSKIMSSLLLKYLVFTSIGWVFETTPKPHRVSGVVLNVCKECISVLIHNHGSPLLKNNPIPI